ncbi:MAG: hypothetical protein RL722_1163 [Pseudomonadota bacterium]|jgi:glyoxylase-like metal-dependent hydrolase (beta-lactamase superfamily II)
MTATPAPDAVLSYPWGETLPARGEVLELMPGLRWVRMGLPFALNHINLWLVRDEVDGQPGWAVIDAGIGNADTREAWTQIFEQALDGLPVLRVIVTHMHPDHVGNAAWIARRWGSEAGEASSSSDCPVWMSATDWAFAQVVRGRAPGDAGAAAAAFFARHGMADAESLAKVSGRGGYFAALVPELPARYSRLMDGKVLQLGATPWRCIAGYGHAPEHMSLWCEPLGVLISGDMLLPRISTNVSVFDMEPDADPLPLFLDSLGRFETLPVDTLVLPSHGKPFRGVTERIAQLRSHHEDRLAEVLAACAGRAVSAAEVLPVLFPRSLDLHQTTFAMGETLAHLNALLHAGRLRRQRGADGVWRFRRV